MAHVSEPKRLGDWTMDQLLDEYPAAAEILARHGVDPRTRCNVAVRHYLRLKKVLGRNCPVDDPKATVTDLEELVMKAGTTKAAAG